MKNSAGEELPPLSLAVEDRFGNALRPEALSPAAGGDLQLTLVRRDDGPDGGGTPPPPVGAQAGQLPVHVVWKQAAGGGKRAAPRRRKDGSPPAASPPRGLEGVAFLPTKHDWLGSLEPVAGAPGGPDSQPRGARPRDVRSSDQETGPRPGATMDCTLVVSLGEGSECGELSARLPLSLCAGVPALLALQAGHPWEGTGGGSQAGAGQAPLGDAGAGPGMPTLEICEDAALPDFRVAALDAWGNVATCVLPGLTAAVVVGGGCLQDPSGGAVLEEGGSALVSGGPRAGSARGVPCPALPVAWSCVLPATWRITRFPGLAPPLLPCPPPTQASSSRYPAPRRASVPQPCSSSL